jgi:hypothetical protein
MISSMLDPDGGDGLVLETMSHILQTLAAQGNLSATEFITHLQSAQKVADNRWHNTSSEGERRNDLLYPHTTGVNTSVQMTLEDELIQNISLDDELQLDGDEFWNPLIGFGNEPFFGSSFVWDENSPSPSTL